MLNLARVVEGRGKAGEESSAAPVEILLHTENGQDGRNRRKLSDLTCMPEA